MTIPRRGKRNRLLEKVLEEHERQRTGETDQERVKRLGAGRNAEYVLAGSVGKLGRLNRFAADVLDIEDGSFVDGYSERYNLFTEGVELMPKLAASLNGGAAVALRPPVNVRAGTPGYDSIPLSWDSAGDGVKYRVYYGTESDPAKAGAYDVTVSGTSVVIPKLQSGRVYYFWISTVNEGESPRSAVVSARTASERPAPVNFVYVEGGTFSMGSANGENDERPVHTVTVKGFFMSKYEVTQKEWIEVMGTNVRQQRDMADKSWPLRGEGDTYPIYYVNWYEAVEYCNRRSVKEGLTPAYRGNGNSITWDRSANGYRLPTEAEWEYAAKGGNKDYLTYEYSGSNSVEGVAWYSGNSGNTTHPVGTKTPNSLGLYDMSGNVWEWCWDWYGSYGSGAQTDPVGASSGTYRLSRGGSWSSNAQYARSADRGSLTPSDRNYYLGFRLVRP